MLSIALLTLISLTSVSYIAGEDTPQEQVQEHTEKIDRVVKGDVFIIPNGIYSGSEDIDTAHYDLTVSEKEPSLQIWATSKGYPDTLIIDLSNEEKEDTEGSCNWNNHGHPRLYKFPWHLPLNLFVDKKGELKKEGDTVTILHNNPKTSERIQVELTLRQNDYRYRYCGGGQFDECIRSQRDYELVAEPYLMALTARNRN